MDFPVIVQVIGLPGTGKTLVAKTAQRVFAWQQLRTAWLDIDQFARCYQGMAHNLDAAEHRHTPRFVQDVFNTFKAKMHELKRRFTPSEQLACDPYVVQAVKRWILDQQADVVFLEQHWLANLYCYPRHELWLVTAPPDLCLHRLMRPHGALGGSKVQATMQLALAHNHWSHYTDVLHAEKALITNNGFGRNGLRRRIATLADDIGWRQASGKYASEDDRPTIPPTKI